MVNIIYLSIDKSYGYIGISTSCGYINVNKSIFNIDLHKIIIFNINCHIKFIYLYFFY